MTLITFSLLAASTCKAQNDQEQVPTDTVKQMNLLDEQTKMFGQIFDMAGAGTDNPFQGADSYLEAIEQMEATEEEKQFYREQYKLYDLSLDPTKKDSLRLMTGKMLEDAIEKTQSDIEN